MVHIVIGLCRRFPDDRSSVISDKQKSPTTPTPCTLSIRVRADHGRWNATVSLIHDLLSGVSKLHLKGQTLL